MKKFNTLLWLSMVVFIAVPWLHAQNTENIFLPSIPTGIINVKDHGAKGDGETDDSKAIQNIINMAAESGGAIIFFPTGKYLLKEIIIPASNITLKGVGKSSLLQFNFPPYKAHRKVYYGFHFTNQKNVRFTNMAIDGGAQNYHSNPVEVDGTYHLIYFNPETDNAVENILIENCYLSNSFDSAIQSYGSSAQKYPHPITNNIKIEKSYFYNIGAHGVGMNEWTNSYVRNCTFINVGQKIMIGGYGSGMAVDVSGGCQNIIVSGNFVDGAAAGFKAESHKNEQQIIPSSNIIIENNFMNNIKQGPDYRVWYGIRVNGTNITVRGNTVESFMHGILLGPQAENCIITENYILKTIAKDAAGIRVDFSNGNHNISNNYIANVGAQGILVSGNYHLITKNHISNSGLEGIRIADGEGLTVSENISFNNKSEGISVIPINLQARKINLLNNVTYDSREGNNRTQKRGIFIAAERVSEIRQNGNTSFNNILEQISPSEEIASQKNNSDKVILEKPPQEGTWKVGDIIYNKNPKPGKFVGWVCTKEGTPGEWKGFGLILP